MLIHTKCLKHMIQFNHVIDLTDTAQTIILRVKNNNILTNE